MSIQENKERFYKLITSIKRPNCNVERLLDKLENSDFYNAPASTVYHNAKAGGLCEHCLNVYDELHKLVQAHHAEGFFDPDSLIIVSLLHDISKMDYYEPTVMNKKVYSPSGSKTDELGKFDWKSIPGFKVKESTQRFCFGSHEETSEFMVRCFIPLTVEESVAILHHSGFAGRPTNYDLTTIYNNYSLALFLHIADMLATYYVEKI